MSDEEVLGWVWPSNVRPLLTHLSLYAGYNFDDSDWQAVETALPDTNADDSNKSYEYPVAGQTPVVVRLARNPGGEPVDVRVTGPMNPILRARIQTLLDILAEVEGTPRD